METLSALAQPNPGGADIYAGLAELYAWVARENGEDAGLRALIERFRAQARS
jgi:hypothetical protein